jgi:hypothetical protein
MKRGATFLVLIAAGFMACGAADEYRPRSGDIVFQTSRSAQSVAVQKATKSAYSHMGIVYVRGGEPYVYEAVGPVKLTPLSEWIERGLRGHFVARRLREAEEILTVAALERMLAVGRTFDGKPYDLYFEWSDDRIYCSELVWKIYKRALNLEVGKLQVIAEFDLSDPIVQSKFQERFGGPPPPQEVVVSPAAIFSSPLLVTVFER